MPLNIMDLDLAAHTALFLFFRPQGSWLDLAGAAFQGHHIILNGVNK